VSITTAVPGSPEAGTAQHKGRIMTGKRRTPYIETFDHGPGGWHGGVYSHHREDAEIKDSVLVSRGPWWIDSNHAPPGAGYLHLLAYLHTHAQFVTEASVTTLGQNRFVEDAYSTDMTNARVTVRLRGEVDLRGSQLVLLAQADVPGTRTNFVLSEQPLRVTPDWSEQSLLLSPHPRQWTCLGSRHDRTDMYGVGNIADVLRDLNVDIIFVLFPLNVVPLGEVSDPHKLLPGSDYEADPRCLPSGEVCLDTVRIDYA